MKKVLTLLFFTLSTTVFSYVECGCSTAQFGSGFVLASYVVHYSYLSDVNGNCCSDQGNGNLAYKSVSAQGSFTQSSSSGTYTSVSEAQGACC